MVGSSADEAPERPLDVERSTSRRPLQRRITPTRRLGDAAGAGGDGGAKRREYARTYARLPDVTTRSQHTSQRHIADKDTVRSLAQYKQPASRNWLPCPKGGTWTSWPISPRCWCSWPTSRGAPCLISTSLDTTERTVWGIVGRPHRSRLAGRPRRGHCPVPATPEDATSMNICLPRAGRRRPSPWVR